MTIAITHKGLGHLLEAVSAADTTMRLSPGDAQAFINVDGEVIYALLRGTIDREIVKIDAEASDAGTGELVVARGQGGSISNAWPAGALILAVTNSDHYNSLQQRGKYRTIDFSPNQVLNPLFAGEKVYQSGPAGCERWWKSFDDTNPYWDIITGLPCGSEVYKDIGWLFDLLVPDELICWQEYTIPALWDVLAGTWDGDSYSHSLWVILEATVDTWQEGFRPPLMRISRSDAGGNTRVTLKDTSNFTIVGQDAEVDGNGTEFELSWLFDNDMERLSIQRLDGSSIDVNRIEFFECDLHQITGEASDGWVRVIDPSWSACRSQATGETVDNTSDNIVLAAYFSTNYTIYRGFIFFDLSSQPFSQLHSAKLKLYRYSLTGGEDVYFIPCASDDAPPVTTAMYDAGYTALASQQLCIAGDMTFNFNAFGMDFINSNLGGTMAICIKEYTYDYLGAAPPGVNFANYRSADYSSAGQRPRLLLYGEV